MMYTTTGGPPPWPQNGAFNHPAYVQVPIRNPYSSPLPPPPTYAPQPLQSAPVQQPPMSHSNNAAQQPRSKIEWSPSVREYVSRCFAPDKQIPGVEREVMEAKLKEVITRAAQSNELEKIDWASMPLPQTLIQLERSQILLGSQRFPHPFVPPPPMPPGSNGFQAAVSAHSLRKRKSSELESEPTNSAIPPWRNGVNNKKGLSLQDRISPADKRQKTDTTTNTSKSMVNLEQRKKRFGDDRSGSNSPRKATSRTSPVPVEPVGPVVGRSQKLEKNYFRLTSAPNPEDVRPLSILKQTLDLLKKKWKQDSNYGYICDQFKSLRQDLTVQHIKNEFTTNVYEIHARIALEKGDLGEYNQCQTQLRSLYKQGLGGHPTEFKAYRILYYIYTCNRTDMNDVLSDLTPADKASKAVKHALDVRSALALGNYHKFFKLYLDVPNMGAYLMDIFIERERLAALAVISRTYKPSVRLSFVALELAFESDEDAAQFILDHNGKELLEEKEDCIRMLTGKRLFEDAKAAAFSRVDIKGQI